MMTSIALQLADDVKSASGPVEVAGTAMVVVRWWWRGEVQKIRRVSISVSAKMPCLVFVYRRPVGCTGNYDHSPAVSLTKILSADASH